MMQERNLFIRREEELGVVALAGYFRARLFLFLLLLLLLVSNMEKKKKVAESLRIDLCIQLGLI